MFQEGLFTDQLTLLSDRGYWFVKPLNTPIAYSPSGFNTPPTAVIAVDQDSLRNYEVLIDATGSRDPDGTIVRYRYDLMGMGFLEIML